MKPLFVISSPFDTYSGYGARARDLIKAIIETDKYEVKLMSQRWGNTPFGFCKDNPEWNYLLEKTLPGNQLQKQPDIWAQITVPNEFQKVGKYNIGFTAGIETTSCVGDWIEGCNRMDLNIVSSEHSKKVFLNSKFEKRNKQTNALEGNIELNKPMEVLFEGANLDIYKHLSYGTYEDNLTELKNVKEKFAYLFVGHWIQGDLGEDRKNVGLLIKAFFEVFKNKVNRPALILKTSQVGSSYLDREEVIKKIKKIAKTVNSKNLPNVYLLNGELSDSEINELYNHPKVKAMVSLTKGEGFGRPLLEFTTSKKPLITTNFSGHLDFLDSKFTTLLNGELKNVHPSAANNFLLQESKWFSPDHNEVGFYLKDVFENYKKYTSGAKKQYDKTINEFSWNKMKEKIDNILDNYIPEFPKEIKLELPKLNKIQLPKLEKTDG